MGRHGAGGGLCLHFEQRHHIGELSGGEGVIAISEDGAGHGLGDSKPTRFSAMAKRSLDHARRELPINRFSSPPLESLLPMTGAHVWGETGVRYLTIALSGLCVLLRMEPAHAAQTSAGVNFHINIQTSCSVTAENIDFGNVGLITGGETASAAVRVVCSLGTPYQISFGAISSVTAFNGQMTNSSNHVNYSASLSAAGGTGPGVHTITAILAAQPTPPDGLYTDSRTVYLNY
jgi:spore coat protein U-like protein